MHIMSQVQPHDSRVTSDAKETMDQCILQFSVALTRATKQECRRDQRMTITGDDPIVGFASLGLVDYVHPMTEYLRLSHENVN
jgi:histone H3/H4